MKATKFVAFNDVTEYYFLYRYPLYNFVLFYYLWKSIGLSAVTCQLSTNSLISWPVVYSNKAKSMISDDTVEFADKVSLEKYVRLNIIITLHLSTRISQSSTTTTTIGVRLTNSALRKNRMWKLFLILSFMIWPCAARGKPKLLINWN